MPVIAAILLIANTTCSGMQGRVARSSRNAKLENIPCSGTCDLQLVADDWSGSGSWSSRVGGWTATVTGSPTKVATKFASRSAISGFSSGNYFTLAANAAHTIQATEATTYEFLVRLPAVFTAAGNVVGYNNGATLPIASLGWLTSAGGNYENVIYNNIGGTLINTISSNTLSRAGEYYLLTVTIDMVAPRVEQYVNGVSTHSSTLVTGTIASTPSSTMGIGIRAVSLNNVWGGEIMEIVRHKQVFNAATVLSRASNFNVLRGY